jgi:type I restriction enzyme M protein
MGNSVELPRRQTNGGDCTALLAAHHAQASQTGRWIEPNLLFFDRTGPTKDIWYYEQPLPEGRKNYTKTAPIQFDEFATCVAWWKKREENKRAWKFPAKDLLKYDTDGNLLSVNLDIKNPTAKEDIAHLPPEQLAESIVASPRRGLRKAR